ncbi:hypothetical protein AAZX31_19G205900 [Glycine max]
MQIMLLCCPTFILCKRTKKMLIGQRHLAFQIHKEAIMLMNITRRAVKCTPQKIGNFILFVASVESFPGNLSHNFTERLLCSEQ